MLIGQTILKANLSIEQILVVYEREIDFCKYGYMGSIELNYFGGECIELDHIKQTLSIYNRVDDHFVTYYWWSGAQVWKDYSK